MSGSKTRFEPALLLAVLLLAAPYAVEAQIYRWVDENGQVHFTDRPPPGKSSEVVPIRSQPTDLEATLREQIARESALQARDEGRADDAADAAAEREHRDSLARACSQAQDRVTRIESARRLSRVEEDGSRRTYSDAERAEALAEARRQVSEWCR